MIMSRNWWELHESHEKTVASFLKGLNQEIADEIELQMYGHHRFRDQTKAMTTRLSQNITKKSKKTSQKRQGTGTSIKLGRCPQERLPSPLEASLFLAQWGCSQGSLLWQGRFPPGNLPLQFQMVRYMTGSIQTEKNTSMN